MKCIVRLLGAVLLLFVVTAFVYIAGHMSYTFFESMQRVAITLAGLGVLILSVGMLTWRL